MRHLAIAALLALAIGPAPRYLEELAIGGGYGDPVDGGADLDRMGNIRANGDLACGSIDAAGGASTVGVNDATAGTITAFGNDTTDGGAIRLYSSASNDGSVDYWTSFSGLLGAYCLAGYGGAFNPGIVMSANPSTGEVTYNYDAAVLGGDLHLGTSAANRGALTLYEGPSAPGCIEFRSANGAARYLFASNDGAGLRIHTALPTSDADGVWPAAGKFRGGGSTTDAVDLGSAEVSGTLAAARVGNGLTDAQVSDTLTLSGGVVNSTPIGLATPAAGQFTTLAATGSIITPPVWLSANDTTPDVSGASVFRVPGTWTAGNNITAFDGGTSGQRITLIGGDSDCVVTDTGSLLLAGSWTASQGDALELLCVGTDWLEISRSNN